MTIFEITDLLSYYGADVIIFSCVVALLTQILKKTLLSSTSKKIITFLPFVLGIFIFSIYELVVTLDINIIYENYLTIFESGMSIGSCSTFLYVVYEQFIRGEKVTKASVISSVVSPYVAVEKLNDLVESLVEVLPNDLEAAQKLMEAECSDSVSNEELAFVLKMIVRALEVFQT